MMTAIILSDEHCGVPHALGLGALVSATVCLLHSKGRNAVLFPSSLPRLAPPIKVEPTSGPALRFRRLEPNLTAFKFLLGASLQQSIFARSIPFLDKKALSYEESINSEPSLFNEHL